ncbi:hypothetical protein [Clostridium sp. SHJSY1]|uniref:hypothetical protein n=1 Tax=Clostridium sp. SHJSY1 TaxID=2942483 RepID=UPI0037BF7D4F
MNILKKSLSLIIVSIFLLQSIENTTYASPTLNATTPIKAAVFLNNFNDLFIDDAKKALENVQREHENKVEFTFFDSKGNQLIENENIDIAISDKYDFFVVNPVTTKKEEIEDTLNKIIHKNIPLILYLSS